MNLFNANGAHFRSTDAGHGSTRADDIAAALRPIREIEPLLSRRYLVKGWIDCATVSVVYGESNVGKTFFALDLALHVAAGRIWRGHRVQGGPVVYVAAEGGFGIHNRIVAARTADSSLLTEAEFHLLPIAIDLFEAIDSGALHEALNKLGVRPDMIVFDTLARSMGGGDENSAQDMGKVIASIDRIRRATAAHVMVVHHSGKDTSRGARGSSALRAAVDTEVELTRKDEVITAAQKKQRDQAVGPQFSFRLDDVLLGIDEDGDPVTTCRVVPCDVPYSGADRRKPSPSEARVLQALGQYIADYGKPNPCGTGWRDVDSSRVVQVEPFKAFAGEKQHHETTKERSRAVRDALKGLEKKGIVAFKEEHVWIVKREGTEGT